MNNISETFCNLCLNSKNKLVNLHRLGEVYNVSLERLFGVFKLPLEYQFPESSCEHCSKQLEMSYTFFQQVLHAMKDVQCLSKTVSTTESGRITYPCDMCDLNFELDFDLQRHRKLVHVGQLPNYFRCSTCHKLFKTNRGLQQHSSYCHNTDPDHFHCNLCYRDFLTKTSYINHMKYHKDFLCKFCDHGWITEAKLLEHVKNVHKDRLFRCKQCAKTERLRKTLNRHLRSAHNVTADAWYCGHCANGVSFKEISILSKHINETHSNLEEVGSTYDEILNESFFVKDIGLELEAYQGKPKQDENQEMFLRHFNLVRINDKSGMNNQKSTNLLNPNKMILEEFLDEAFENDQIWTKYIEGGEEYLIDNYEFYLESPSVKNLCKYKCPKCEEGFNKQHNLTVHLAEIHGISCLICNDCGANFNKIHEYKSHRQEHLKDNARFRENIIPEAEEALFLVQQKEKEYSIDESGSSVSFICKLCDRTFSKKCNLEKHQCSFYSNIPKIETSAAASSTVLPLISAKQDSLFCTLCDKKFTSISGLKYHLKRHTDIKAFPCMYCSKKFTANSNLNAHIRNVHSEHKSHVCSECDMRFACKDHFTKHVRSKHRQERAFACPECPKRYFQKSHLNDHVAATHMEYTTFTCELCPNSYSCRGSLRRHVAKHHKVPEI